MHRANGKRFVVHTEEKLTVFVELESTIRSSDAVVTALLTQAMARSAGARFCLSTPLPEQLVRFLLRRSRALQKN
jgi:hypothetical protein